MPTYLELLPATKSSSHNGIRWTPSEVTRNSGLLTIETKRVDVTYLVCEMEACHPYRNFVFAKTEGTPGSDKTEPSYTVSVGVAGSPHACTCKGYAYGRGKPCKHIEAVVAIMDNGWMDRDQTNSDADSGNTEMPF